MAGTSFGQTRTGRINKDPYYFAAVNCPVSTTIVDGSRLICKAGGVAWFVAPDSTEVGVPWANGCYQGINTSSKCCISEWGVLGNCLSTITCCWGTNGNNVYSSWSVPTQAQLCNPMFTCRINWNCNGSAKYWSSQNQSADGACTFYFLNGSVSTANKIYSCPVRVLKCVTY